jgi:hypothetical protein
MNEKTENKNGPITESIIATGELCNSLVNTLERLEKKLEPIRVMLPTNSLLAEEKPMPDCSEIEERLLSIRRVLDGAAYRIDLLTKEIRL